ncbi:hypothetical protein AHiyo8_13060 [Arthrobacter sp. Hiyo8]|nr:hypothetical protein AHiyo8_13060 [Arthrobacter sp. Hiyo8]
MTQEHEIPADSLELKVVHLPQLQGSAAAPPARTLVEILQDTARTFPEASASMTGTSR